MARHPFAVITLAAIALVSSFWFLLDVLGAANHSRQTFGVGSFENRFNDFQKTIKPHTVYGYLSDTPANDPSAVAEFRLTQYVVAPAILKPSTHENLVLVNYHSKDLDTKLLAANHLRPFRNIGNGLLLCQGDKQ